MIFMWKAPNLLLVDEPRNVDDLAFSHHFLPCCLGGAGPCLTVPAVDHQNTMRKEAER